MASEGKMLFDLNELPTEDDDGSGVNQPQKAIPSASPNTSTGLLATPQDKANSRVFLHASTASGFQPFVRPLASQHTDVVVERKTDEVANVASSSSVVPDDAGAPEREEGELMESEAPASDSIDCKGMAMPETGVSSDDSKVTEKGCSTVGLDVASDSGLQKRNVNLSSEGSGKDSASIDGGPQEQGLTVKQRETKGVEASHAIKCANTTVKRKWDQQKETMLGKKRNRQTMFLNLEDVKQAGPIKTTTPRRQNFPQPVVTRTVRESRAGAEQGTSEQKSESNGESQPGLVAKTRRINGDAGPSSEGTTTSVSRQGSWKQPAYSQSKPGQSSSRQVSLRSQSSADSKFGNKKLTSFKKPVTNSTQYQDTSVERLIREVTNEKFWHHPGMSYIVYLLMELVFECSYFFNQVLLI